MPAKNSFTRDMLIDSAFKLVRTRGIDKLSARTLAKELNCSTQPIYSNFKSMSRLDMELRKKAVDVLLKYQTTPRSGEVFFDMGFGYILFAKREKHLFRFLYGGSKRGRSGGYGKTLKEIGFQNLLQRMKDDPLLNGLNEKQLESVLTKMWIFVHGIAFLIVNNAFAEGNDNYIERLLKETGFSIIEGEKQNRA